MSSQRAAQAVEDTLRAFFDGISTYDYQRLENLTTADYTLIENGPVWALDSLTVRLRQLEEKGATIDYEFSDMETTVAGPTAWMTYKNHGVMSMGEQQQELNWSESAVFRKGDEGWKIVLLHSTQVGTDSPHGGQ